MLRRRISGGVKGVNEYGFDGQDVAYINFDNFPLWFEDSTINFEIKFNLRIPSFAVMSAINELVFGNSVSTSVKSVHMIAYNDGRLRTAFAFASIRFTFTYYISENVWTKMRFKKVGTTMYLYINDVLETTLPSVGGVSTVAQPTYMNVGNSVSSRRIHGEFKNDLKFTLLDVNGDFDSYVVNADLNQSTGIVVPNSGSLTDGDILDYSGLVYDSWWFDVS